MALLTFLKGNQELIRYTLRKESTAVGRSATADICLPDSNISRTHFMVSSKNGKFHLTDRSTNGTLVNGRVQLSCELQEGDRVRLGDWEVVFSFAAPEGETQMITVSEERDPTEVLAYEAESMQLKVRRAFLQRTDGKAPGIFPIRKEIISLGKATGNDIVIADDTFVSNHHCKIENRRGRYFLKDLKSTNGTFVGNQQVIDVSLPPESLIRVGKTDFRFFLAEENEKLKPVTGKSFHGMIGGSSKMRQLYALLERVSKSDATVLLLGETGSGKELVARGVHELSARREKKIITLNCTAIAKDLIESELFGHEKGAFTSAHQQRKGAFEEAHGGTLFLDEIGDMPLELQPKLLRVLENREIKRVGSSTLIDIDVRVIAATHQDLPTMVKKGQFREDLFYRLFVVPLVIPPLRERIEDIPALAEHFLREVKHDQKEPHGFSPGAIEALISYAWPGNIRELKNVISRAALNAPGELIQEGDLAFSPQTLKERTIFEGQPGATLSSVKTNTTKTLKDFEREKILQELIKNQWNKKKTAEVLGIAKTTLFEKIKKYQLKP